MIRYKADHNHDYIEFHPRFKVRTDVNPYFYYICIKPFKLALKAILKSLLYIANIFYISKKEINLLEYYCVFNLKWLKKNSAHKDIIKKTRYAKKLQDKYYKKSQKEKIILFLLPQNLYMCGGIMSAFSLAKYSRQVCPNADVLLVTYPGKYTYFKHTLFKNKELIFRWEQIIRDLPAFESVIIHIMEFIPEYFYKMLTKKDISTLKNLKNLQINILNQRDDVCASSEMVNQYIKPLTSNVTMTTAHPNYATQDKANEYGIPVHLFHTHLDLTPYKPVTFEEKEKLILISADEGKKISHKTIQRKVHNELKGYKCVIITKMSFSAYMSLAAKSIMSISLGEGFDGWIVHPLFVGSLGMAVYNDEYFPDKSWQTEPNIYATEEEMLSKMVEDIKYWQTHKDEYIYIYMRQLSKIKELYKFEDYLDNLKRFYEQKYDYLPHIKE